MILSVVTCLAFTQIFLLAFFAKMFLICFVYFFSITAQDSIRASVDAEVIISNENIHRTTEIHLYIPPQGGPHAGRFLCIDTV